MIIERLTPATDDPGMVDDLRAHARLDGNAEDDAQIVRMARAASREAEGLAQIALLNQTIRVTLLDGWPGGATLPLPVAPLLDASTVEVTADFDAFTDFRVVTGLRPAIHLTGWPPAGVVVIEYQAGFGPDSDSLPDDLREAIHDQAVAYYDLRGPGDPKASALSPHFARIVGRYRAVRA